MGDAEPAGIRRLEAARPFGCRRAGALAGPAQPPERIADRASVIRPDKIADRAGGLGRGSMLGLVVRRRADEPRAVQVANARANCTTSAANRAGCSQCNACPAPS